MLDLGNLLLPAATAAIQLGDPSCSSSSSSSRPETLDADPDLDGKWSRRLRFAVSTRGTCSVLKRERKVGKKVADGKAPLEDHVQAWKEKKISAGFSEEECFLPFLTNAPRMVDCRICNRCIYPGEEVRCLVTGCREGYHSTCVKQMIGSSTLKPFKCPQHSCFVCKQKAFWRCVRCEVAAHPKCAPWPMDVIYLKNRPGRAVCWRHPSDWRLEKEVG